jgi:hypothetical protein
LLQLFLPTLILSDLITQRLSCFIDGHAEAAGERDSAGGSTDVSTGVE